MATAVSLGVVCALGLALGSARHRVVAVGCALTLLLPLALSFSRGAWIATLVTCSVQLMLAGVRRALKIGVVLAAVCTTLVGGLGVGTAVLEERIDSITQVTATPISRSSTGTRCGRRPRPSGVSTPGRCRSEEFPRTPGRARAARSVIGQRS